MSILPVVGVFMFSFFLMALIWVVMLVLNLWIWQKAKSQGNLLMTIGAGLLAFASLDAALGLAISYDMMMWFHVIGSGLVVAGFYMSVKPMVAAQLAHLQSKMKGIGHKDSGTPPKA